MSLLIKINGNASEFPLDSKNLGKLFEIWKKMADHKWLFLFV